MEIIDFDAFQPLSQISMITGEVIIRSFFSSDMKDQTLNNKLIQVELSDLVSELSELQRKQPHFILCAKLLGQRAWSIYPSKYIKSLKSRSDNLLKLCEECIKGRLEKRRDHYLKNIPEDQEEE